jgi:release factor glutamine methyltransferase
MDASDQPWNILRLLNWTRDYFKRCRLESPRLCAEMLLAHTLHCSRMDLYARFDHQPEPAQLDTYRQLVRQAGQGEPVAYLVGEKEFYSLAMIVTPDVLIPRPETEILVDQAIAQLRGRGEVTLWDTCTGCGCVAVAAAKNLPDARVLATDISPQAVAVTEKNITRHQLGERVTAAVADLATLPEDWPGETTFDMITANPPYIGIDEPLGPTVEREPALALRGGDDGLDLVRQLIAQVPDRLKPHGWFCMEFGMGQADAVRDLIVDTGRFAEPDILTDIQDLERTAVTQRHD